MSLYATIEKNIAYLLVPNILATINLVGIDVNILQSVETDDELYEDLYGSDVQVDSTKYSVVDQAKVLFPLSAYRIDNNLFSSYFETIVCYSNKVLKDGDIIELIRLDNQSIKFKVNNSESLGNTSKVCTRFVLASLGD